MGWQRSAGTASRRLPLNLEPALLPADDRSPVAGEESLSPLWRQSAIFCVAGLLALPVVLSTTTSALVATWSGSATYSHCFFIPLISAYLVWERRQSLVRIRPTPSFVGFGLLAASGAVWSLGALSGTPVVAEFALAGMAQSIVVALLGSAVGGALLFPLLYLFFAVPVGDVLIPHLQTVTAFLAVALLKLSGVPVRADGLFIYSPTGEWLVAEACSGVRFLIASIAIGALLSNLFLRTWKRRAAFMTLSVVVPILANGIRAFGIVLIGYLTSNEFAAGADHILYGWLFFALVMLLMLAIVVAMRETVADGRQQPRPVRRAVHSDMAAARFGAAAAALAAVLIVIGLKMATAYADLGSTDAVVPSQLPMSVRAPWVERGEADDKSPPEFIGANRVWHEAYSDGGTTVYLSLGYFIAERHGAEVASSIHRFGGAMTLSGRAKSPELAIDGQSFAANALTFVEDGNRRLVWYWYRVAGRSTGNAYLAKLLQLRAKLLGGPRAAAIVSVAMDEVSGADEAVVPDLTSFVSRLHVVDAQ